MPQSTNDERFFTALFAEHFAYVWRSLLRLGVPARDAEDLSQDVFVVVHRRLDSYDRNRPIRPWLLGICYNVYRDYCRRARNRYERFSQQWEDAAGSDPNIRAMEAAQLVRRALQAIPPPRRAVFILYELDQAQIRDIAHALRIPENTVRSRLRKGREEFRAGLRALQGESAS